MHFSTQQQNAIDARGASILLSAAAGSGKTTVMIQRIMTMLSQGLCRADELLVLTFTRAASANMRTKLENALDSALGENPDNACAKIFLSYSHACRCPHAGRQRACAA